MQKINPLYILLSISTLLIFIYTKNTQTKDELDTAIKSYIKVNNTLQNIVKLKQRWENSKKRVDTILSMKKYKHLKVKKQKTKYGYKIDIEDIKPDIFDRLFDRLINSYIRYKAISVIKSNETMTIGLEIYR